jgi:hypothetical protein
VAVVRNSGSSKIYLNGTGGTAVACAVNWSTNSIFNIASDSNATLNAYISNLRVLKGTALYTSNFTPPTANLTAIANTSLLTCQNSTLIDNSNNVFTITSYGDARPIAQSPFTQTTTAINTTYLGSGYFDGTGDQLSYANNPLLAFFTSNFTVECWIYPQSASGQSVMNYSNGQASNSNFAWEMYQISGTTIQFGINDSDGATGYVASSTGLLINRWNHIAAVRNGNTMSIYVNGVAGGTTVTVTGSGFADIFQPTKFLSVTGLASTPTPGAALNISGDPVQYRVVVITNLGSTKYYFQISPALTILKAPAHSTGIIIRQKYSQCRITGHDFLLIGTGNATTTNYPNVDVSTSLNYRQITESAGGRVFQTSTDQDGNFLVGNLFGVQQASGIVTISADQFSLDGLKELTIGGLSVGPNAVVIEQFSTDSYFIANSDKIIPTQRAIKTYLARNVAGGGANATAGQVTAGTVGVGGPNRIFSPTLSTINVPRTVNFTQSRAGVTGGINGTMLAAAFFNSSFSGGANTDE